MQHRVGLPAKTVSLVTKALQAGAGQSRAARGVSTTQCVLAVGLALVVGFHAGVAVALVALSGDWHSWVSQRCVLAEQRLAVARSMLRARARRLALAPHFPGTGQFPLLPEFDHLHNASWAMYITPGSWLVARGRNLTDQIDVLWRRQVPRAAHALVDDDTSGRGGAGGARVPPMPELELLTTHVVEGQLPPAIAHQMRVHDGRSVFIDSQINTLVGHARAGRYEQVSPPHYNQSARDVALALKAVGVNQHARVLVHGSISPWVESLVLAAGARHVHTADYNPPLCSGTKLVSCSHANSVLDTFDVVVSYSSLEHDGLGRYGDPLCVAGDLIAADELYALLRPGGILLLAVPVAHTDFLKWPFHRVYGPKRLPRLVRRFQVIGVINHGQREHLVVLPEDDAVNGGNQPLLLLKKPLANATQLAKDEWPPLPTSLDSARYAHWWQKESLWRHE